jgi:hypothetical protein
MPKLSPALARRRSLDLLVRFGRCEPEVEPDDHQLRDRQT